MKTSKSANILGVGVGSGTLDAIIEDSLTRIDTADSTSTFVCANPHSLVVAKSDATFTNALNDADYSVADGVGVTMAGRLLGADTGPRIAGHDYFESLMTAMDARGNGKVFFFGSSEHVLQLITDRLRRDYPNIDLCGTLSPPFGDWSDEKNDEMIAKINAASPDVLWVGMTAPKQEKWSEANRDKLDVRILGSIGAVFDFYAGTYMRAPDWAGRFGIEWLYRLVKEPRRMWRRNFVSTPLFIWHTLLQKLTG